MLLLYYTHSVLFYLGLPTFQTNSDFKKHLHSIDYDYLPQEVCVARCLQQSNGFLSTTEDAIYAHVNDNRKDRSLKICLDKCTSSVTDANQTESRSTLPPPKQIHENYSLNLICRDDSSLNLKIGLHTRKKIPNINSNHSKEFETISNASVSPIAATDLRQQDYGTLFVIKIHLANDADKIFVYLSDDNFFTINQLMANTTYNISVLAVHANNKYSAISQQQQFKTLRRGYTPGNVTEIKITEFTEDVLNKMYLTATVTWKPAADMTCVYNIICFSPEREDYDLQPLEIRNPRNLYKHQLENLTFSSVYKVGIRASNTKGKKESELFWKTFKVPSCIEWHNYNFNICAPEAPQNLNVDQIVVDHHKYSLNISWDLPSHLPENYTLRVQDLSVQGNTTSYFLPKHITNYIIEEIYFYGVFYEVSLTAYTRGGHTTTTFTDITKTVVHLPERNPFVKLIAVILAPIFCVVILALTIFIIYHRRAKLKRYQQRCKYFEDLEKKTPIAPRTNFDFTTNLTANSNDVSYHIGPKEHLLYDDDMEIDSNDIILYQVLGEGAFGLVRLGIYKDKKLGTTQQVAVKMLKAYPSAEDIYAFRREIEVMKSVEKHPNIVGIIGHCTRFSHQMMLVTEYCSFGNLLNFLRDEWHFLHRQQIKKQNHDSNIAYIDLNQDVSSSQEFQTSNSLASTIEAENIKNILHCGDDDVRTKSASKDNNVIEHFKTKYNDINVTTTKASPVLRQSNNDDNKILPTAKQQTATSKTSKPSPPPTISSAATAAENKSYGYHGFCTNSCKCNVDVIIKNTVSPEIVTQTEEFECTLTEQQSAQHEQQNFNKTCTETTIQIKNCDCKMKENLSRHKFNGAVENKSYFSHFTSDNKCQSSRKVINTPTTILKHHTKRLVSKAPETNLINENENNDDDDENEGNDTDKTHFKRVPLSCADLLNIARQVAVGMEFLAKNKVVHRDLAARNVLVAPDRTIKIADFGLSRDVYQENMYKKTGNGKLPIKWLALESMTHQIYTTQSDVWSYGILLYEIVTLGATPYPSIPTNRLLHLLKSGYRMEKPKGCSQELYGLMFSCWNSEPLARPTFNSIVLAMDKMLNSIDNQKDSPTIYSEVDEHSNKTQQSMQNGTSYESYLRPV